MYKLSKTLFRIGCVLLLVCFIFLNFIVMNLWDTQDHLIDSVIVLQDSLSDLYDYVLEPFETTQVSLSDETRELVDGLWWKHYGGSLTGNVISYDPLSYWSWSMSFDNGILTIETSDGTWFIEMQRKEE